MIKIIRSERFHFILSTILFMVVIHGVYFGNVVAFAANCTSYITHTFSLTGYYYQSSGASSAAMMNAMNDAKTMTYGPGERFNGYEDTFVKCCVIFSLDGSIYEEDNFDLIVINTGDEIDEAFDVAEENRLSEQADHGAFFCWTLDVPGVAKGGVAKAISNTTGDDEIIFPDNASVFALQLSGANNLDATHAFAHEHGHLHGLEHWYQNDSPYDLTLDNVMATGQYVIDEAGLFEWQCNSDQWTDPNHDYDRLGYPVEP